MSVRSVPRVFQVDPEQSHSRQHVLHRGEEVVEDRRPEAAELGTGEPVRVDDLHLLDEGALAAFTRT